METGSSGEFIYKITRPDLASEVAVDKEDVFPEVLATSRMIGLMEVSAARLMKPLLQTGEISVGVGVDIKHFAPTPVDEEVTIVSVFEGMDKKLYLFNIEVSDRAGKVASGKHTRAIVSYDAIMKGAKKRMDSAG